MYINCWKVKDLAKETVNREDEIVKAAIKVFSDKGFDGSTTNEIAKEAGIAEGTIFRYFKTKKDILHRIMLKIVDIVGSTIIIEPVVRIIENNRDKDEREVLFLILKNRIKLANKNLPLIKIVLSELLIRKDIRDLWAEKVISEIKGVLGGYIELKISEGVFKEVDIFCAMRSLMGMTVAYVMQKYFVPGVTNLQDEDTELMKIVDLFISGIKK